jgi:hypothetical protein
LGRKPRVDRSPDEWQIMAGFAVSLTVWLCYSSPFASL